MITPRQRSRQTYIRAYTVSDFQAKQFSIIKASSVTILGSLHSKAS